MNPLLACLGVAAAVVLAAACLSLLSGCAVNGRPMRFEPVTGKGATPGTLSWYIEGKPTNGATISCSFVEFDERGDFIDFRQHRDCEARITNMVASGPVFVVMYCHGWKNNSQSEDVIKFNAFLAKIAATSDVIENKVRVHGIYLSWRGNVVRPFVDKSQSDPTSFYSVCSNIFGGPIVDSRFNRSANWTGWIQENVDFFTRQRAAEHLVSGLPMARAIFTYASAAKHYGRNPGNRVIVMGHSMGALMLERSLGQALTGSLVMEWWDGAGQTEKRQKIALPFDFILFLNSAAPSIYAKELRDFLEANRRAMARSSGNDAPVIVSLTSTADSATGKIYPLAHMFAPLQPSLQRRYTNGIFGSGNQTHQGIRQSKFYVRTPGHQPYLINHWIVPEHEVSGKTTRGTAEVFAENFSLVRVQDPYVFRTSTAEHPAGAWRITGTPPGKPVTLDGLPLAMTHSDYWIVNCGKDLIASHGDIWSTTAMEMYAGLYRLASFLKQSPP